MHRTNRESQGELIYLSERKLRIAARQRGIRTDRWSKETTVDGNVRLSLGLPTVASAEVALSGHTASTADRPGQLERTLGRVVDALDADGLPDLDAGDASIQEGDWFRFRRSLRFGVGSSDDDQSITALVAVDRTSVVDGGFRPGLLIHGSADHVLAPYRKDFDEAVAMRSGSGTGFLFEWALAQSRALDAAGEAGDRPDAIEAALRAERVADEDRSAVDMYRLFAEEDWMRHMPQLANRAPCTGIARASLVASIESSTVVMASPLYVLLQSDPPVRAAHDEARQSARHGLFRRIRQR